MLGPRHLPRLNPSRLVLCTNPCTSLVIEPATARRASSCKLAVCPKTMQKGWPTGLVNTRKPVSRSAGTRAAPRASSSCSARPASVTRMSRCICWGRPGRASAAESRRQRAGKPARAIRAPSRSPPNRRCPRLWPFPVSGSIELGQGLRVRAVDHCLFEASDHMRSMPACEDPHRRAGLRLPSNP